MQDLITTARTWQQLDPEHADVLEHEITAAQQGDETAQATLTARFAGYLTFGTAGLRAPLGPGTTRMNRVVVQRAAAGLADFARQTLETPTVVIGYDARYGSQQFAIDSAAVLTAAGCRVKVMAAHTPTPVLAFALRKFQADIGIMVTASHNPPTDNGYKVYLGPRLVAASDPTGAYAQITAPTDQHIAACIHRWNTATDLPVLAAHGWATIPETIIDDYVTAISEFFATRSSSTPAHRENLHTVYTAMHGVGAETLLKLFSTNGFAPTQVVAEQLAPDPEFPTVTFPNPEEPGALDLAFATAEAAGSVDVVIAHDPDADRLAVAVPVEGRWQRLTGDELGLLLGARLMPSLVAENRTVANSVVSGPQLARLAEHHGVTHEVTPTGFKWICRTTNLGFGYEEALGYAVAPQLVNDKDGISAALVIADFAAELKASGSSLADQLVELTEIVGSTLTDQISVQVPSPSVGGLVVDDLRAAPPHQLAGFEPVITVDYQDPQVGLVQHYGPLNMVKFATQGPVATSVMIRPSGTEPKVKCYITVSAIPGTPQATVTAAMQRLRAQAANLIRVT